MNATGVSNESFFIDEMPLWARQWLNALHNGFYIRKVMGFYFLPDGSAKILYTTNSHSSWRVHNATITRNNVPWQYNGPAFIAAS